MVILLNNKVLSIKNYTKTTQKRHLTTQKLHRNYTVFPFVSVQKFLFGVSLPFFKKTLSASKNNSASLYIINNSRTSCFFFIRSIRAICVRTFSCLSRFSMFFNP